VSSLTFIRWCALASVVGGIVYAGQAFMSLISVMLPPSAYYNLLEVMFLVVLLLGALAAIAGLHTLQREHYGTLGAVASLTSSVGVALILVGAVADVLAGQRYALLAYFLIVGSLVATVGLVSLGVVTVLARVLPWWCGISLIVGSPPFALFLLGPLVGLVWALVGYALFRVGARQPTPRT
jgi:hypothetical protein